jgi:hypothetical protein
LIREGARREVGMFAAVSLAVTVCLVVLTAFASYGQSYLPGERPNVGDLPRIHERYLFYVLPLFVIGMLATTRVARSTTLLRVGMGAAAIAALVPALIPYGAIMNDSVAADTFSLAPFVGRAPDGGVQALTHATLAVVVYASCFAVVYALARPNTPLVVAAVVALFVWIGIHAQALLDVGARSATLRSLPAQADWVDAAAPKDRVVLVESPRGGRHRDLGVAETAFYNLSVTRLYYPCRRLLSPDFGEMQVSLDPAGRLQGPNGPIRAPYAVVPSDSGIEGRVLTDDTGAHLALVEPSGGILRVVAGQRWRWSCPAAS